MRAHTHTSGQEMAARETKRRATEIQIDNHTHRDTTTRKQHRVRLRLIKTMANARTAEHMCVHKCTLQRLTPITFRPTNQTKRRRRKHREDRTTTFSFNRSVYCERFNREIALRLCRLFVFFSFFSEWVCVAVVFFLRRPFRPHGISIHHIHGERRRTVTK